MYNSNSWLMATIEEMNVAFALSAFYLFEYMSGERA